MTKFITYYNLCPIHDPKEFLGISIDKDEGNVITTLAKNIIMVIKVSSQKQIRSWTVLEKLSSKVVYDRRSEKYVGVFGNKALRCWDLDTSDVNKTKKLKFQKSISELVNIGSEDTLVLYSDGSCELLADAIQSRKEEVRNSSHYLQMASSHTLFNPAIIMYGGRQMLTYFEQQNASGKLHLITQLLNEQAEPLRFNIKRENMDVRVVGHTVIEGNDCPLLLTIWSDKRIFLLHLNDNVVPEKSPGNFVSMLSNLNVDNPISVLGISRNFVAIYGANSGQEGASLLLYNTQFKVVKAKQFFKVYFDFSRLWAAQDHILLAMGQNLSVVSYRMSKQLQLAELIGTQTDNDLKMPIEGDNINEEESLQESLKYLGGQVEKEIPSISNDIKDSKDFVHADGNFVPFEPVTDFDKELNELTQLQLQVELVEVERSLEDVNITLMTNCNDIGLSTPEANIIARQLERCGASEHEITEKLLMVLIKANSMQDIALCLRRYNHISEKMLAKTLSHVLQHYNSQLPKEEPILETVHETSEDVKIPELLEEYPILNILDESYLSSNSKTFDSYKVLNIVLSCSFDAESIAVYIRREIDYAQCLILMQHLYHLLTSTAEEAVFEERPGNFDNTFELQVLRWFGVLLNTHFQKLALSKDVKLVELLYKWHQLFALYKIELHQLQQVSALLYNILESKKLSKEKNYSKWYSIEEVVLY